MKELDLNNVSVAFKYKSDKDLKRTLFIFKLIRRPTISNFLSKMALLVVKYNLPFKSLIKKTVFKTFCAGENREEVITTMNLLKRYKVNTVLDYVAEGDNDETGFSKNLKIILDNIQIVGNSAEEKFVGVKLSGLEDVDFIQMVEENGVGGDLEMNHRMQLFVEHVDVICKLAVEQKVRVYFDAEEIRSQGVFDHVVEGMMKKYNKEHVYIYNTVQMYRTDRLDYLQRLLEEAQEDDFLIGMKIVRGAYYEKEKSRFESMGLISPVYSTKTETDEAFNQAVKFCLEQSDKIHSCIATHNLESVRLAVELIQSLGIKDHYSKVFFSQLFGMSDNLTFNLAEGKYNSSKYVPYGEVEKAIPYLLRRAEENSSVEGQSAREYELLLEEKKRRKI